MSTASTPSFITRLLEVARAQPGMPALIAEGQVVASFAELVSRAAGLAVTLRALGAGRGSIVGLGLPRGPEYVIAMVGTWMAGAAFVPLDPALPPARLSLMVRETGVTLVVVAAGCERPPLSHVSLVELDDIAPAEPPYIPYAPDDLAYLIYTSGSTGQPKGVMVSHRGIVNLLDAQIRMVQVRSGSRVLWLVSPSFDPSISDIGVALLAGAAVCTESPALLADSARLVEVLAQRRITYIDLPIALLRHIDPAELPATLETVLFGGEPCPPETVRRWAARVRMVNAYGPTEATVCTSICVCDAHTWQRPLIGAPLPGVVYRIFDEARHPVAPGMPGELYIGGIGLALGYLAQPELTAERFIAAHGERLYRTGDRVVEHANGDIEFLGRVDRQLKLRGMLVAPEEVEAAICAFPAVQRAAVVKTRVGMREVLIGYVQAKKSSGEGASQLDLDSLRAFMVERLPRWMVPAYWDVLDELPATTSGKVDLAALECRPLRMHTGSGMPATAEEQSLIELFREVLGSHDIGREDDFFALGGDSMAVIELLARAAARGLPLTPEMLHRYPVIANLAAHLTRPSADTNGRIPANILRAEAALAGEWTELLAAARARPGDLQPPAMPRAILLTGATGFLGARVALELLARTPARLYCLVRAGDQAQGQRRILQAMARHTRLYRFVDPARITAVPGDLGQQRFGQAPADWATLAAKIDTVHHCAADISMAADYQSVRAANVDGTREIVRFVGHGRRKRLHYASTLSVFVATDTHEGRFTEDDDPSSCQWIVGGYAQSKWVAEALLQATGGHAGPIAMYRFGLLTGDSRTNDGAPTDWLALALRGLARLGCIPANLDPELAMDVTPIDYAAAAMAHLSMYAAPDQGISTFHISGKQAALIGNLAAALAAEGAPLETVPAEQFRARVDALFAQEGRTEDAAAFLALGRALAAAAGTASELHRSFDLFAATRVRFDDHRTQQGLAGSGIVCPQLTQELMQRYVRQALRDRVSGQGL